MRMPIHSAHDAAYVNMRPGSRITLKIETSCPRNPDWYTFHPELTSGWFIEIVVRSSPPPAGVHVTADSYAIAISVPG